MDARKYAVELTGVTPLLMHRSNIQWEEQMKAWTTDPANKKSSVSGDDRSPAWRWVGSLYSDGGIVVVPSDNLMTMLREGGAKCPTGKRGGSFKRQTQSGIMVNEIGWPVLVNGKTIPVQPFEDLGDNNDFAEHEKVAAQHGFTLFVKRAAIGQAKHIRVRPRFDSWTCAGSVLVTDETITKDVLQNILTMAGCYAGMCDWRPSAPRASGPFGRFTATVKEAR